MPNTNPSANMLLPVPVVGVDPGPQYATDVNNCLTLVDQHDHSTGKGVQVTPAGLNINADLSFNNNNLISARSLRMQVQPGVLTLGTDLICFYAVGVDAYYNDGNGNNVRLTQGGAVAGSPGSIANLVSPASASYNSGNSTFVWQSAANTPANMDGASFIFRNLTANSKGLTLQPPSAMGVDYAITLPALPGTTLPISLDSSGVMSTGQITTAQVAPAAITTSLIATQAITQSLLAARPTGSTVAAGGVGTSASLGNASFNSTPFIDMGISVTITTTGRPVYIGFINDGTAISLCQSNAANSVRVFFTRDSGVTSVGGYTFENGTSSFSIPVSSFSTIDFPTAGTYTYTAQVSVSSVAVAFTYAKLLVYEL